MLWQLSTTLWGFFALVGLLALTLGCGTLTLIAPNQTLEMRPGLRNLVFCFDVNGNLAQVKAYGVRRIPPVCDYPLPPLSREEQQLE